MPRTYSELYIASRRALRDAGVSSAGLEARILAAHALGKTPEELIRDGALTASPEEERSLEGVIARRLAGEPAAYITRAWEFYGLPLEITPEVLIPRADTEVLAEAAIRSLAGKVRPRVLDLCTGSGCVGLAIAHEVQNAEVILADVSREALEVARRNIASLELEGRVTVRLADITREPPPDFGELDLIVCNPPYIACADMAELDFSVRGYEPHLALDGGEDGFLYYRALLRSWLGVLHPGGAVMLEVGAGMAETVKVLMEENGLCSIQSFYDTLAIERVITGIY